MNDGHDKRSAKHHLFGAVASAVLVLLSLAFPLINGSTASRTAQLLAFRTADEIKAGYDSRRAKLIQAILNYPGGNLWHAAEKGLVSVFKEPVPPVQALINLSRAAGADPKCEECCEPPRDCGDAPGYWSLPLLIRAYYMFHAGSEFQGGQYAGRIPAEVADQIKGFYRAYLRKGAGKGYGNCGEDDQPRCTAESTITRYDYPPYTYISQSDNHTMIQASSIFLAAQMLKDEGAEYAQLYENWKGWWSRFLDGLAKRGFWETASPTYVERHLAPIYNLYDFAEDPLIQKKAEMLLDWYWAEIAQELLHGVRGGAKMRVYWIAEGDRGAISARNDCMYGIYYLYFGDSFFESSPEAPNSEMHNGVFATSSYQPPDLILELGANPHTRGNYEIKERRKGSCFTWDQSRVVWDQSNPGDKPYNSRRYAYATPDYILGSFQTDADKQFMPLAGGTPHMQNSLVFATSPEARIAWGEWASIGSGQINVFQHENVVLASRVSHPDLMLAYDLPEEGTLDRVEEEVDWLFVQEGQAYAAFRLLYNEILIIEAARSIDYDNDFARFKAAVRQTQTGITLTNIDAGFIEYTTADGDVLWFPLLDSEGSCRYSCNCNPADDRLPKVNGELVDWDAYPLFGSTHVNSAWDSGLVELAFANRKLSLDFRDPDNPIKTEVGPPTPTPTSTSTPTITLTPTPSMTHTATLSPTVTPSLTPQVPTLPTPTTTDTQTATPVNTPTGTHTPTFGPSPSPTNTPVIAPVPTPPGNGGIGGWLSRLLRSIVEWINRLLAAIRGLLPSGYPNRPGAW